MQPGAQQLINTGQWMIKLAELNHFPCVKVDVMMMFPAVAHNCVTQDKKKYEILAKLLCTTMML